MVRPSPESDGQWEGLYGRKFPSAPTSYLRYLSEWSELINKSKTMNSVGC